VETLKILRQGPVARVVMSRPERHNAFNETVGSELLRAFEELGADAAVRVIVLEGEGPSFSAGADLEWMQEMARAALPENRASAERMAAIFERIDTCPKPVVARVHGPALGGGCGLVCAADIALAGPRAVFGFTEVRLGILPAVISPYAIRRLGLSQARARFLTGARFGAEEALRIGLVHALAEDLDAEVGRTVEALLAGGPQTQAGIKDLVRTVSELPRSEQKAYTVEMATRSRASPEGQEGMAAFLQKRRPAWIGLVEDARS
jgi:methylglutaconyl-CoA hydratase